MIGGRRRDVGEQAAAQNRNDGGRALFTATDVTVESDVERLTQLAVAEFGRLDGAVNNAGGVNATGPGHAIDGPAWHADLEQNLTLEGASNGIRVNALVTGNVDTPLYRSLLGAPPEGELQGPAPNPTGQVSSPDEIAAFVAFLLSDESAFITGAALAIDGGSTAQ